MKAKILFCFFFLLHLPYSFSQSGQWAWVHGDTIANSPGRFGIKGVADPANNPPGLYETYNWNDKNGNLWIYGGYNTTTALCADMWMFNPYTNLWTWMQGDSIPNVVAVHGTQGVPSPLNTPGSRNTGISWVDTSGNFWLYGGFINNLQYSGDLWMFNTSTLEWTWMSGSLNTSTVGTLQPGIPSTTDYPPSIVESSAGWIDNQNQLWIFGGIYLNTCCPYDRVLRYSISTNEWTWLRGSTFSQAPVAWGTMGVAAPTNNPGARSVYAHWEDQYGNFWFNNGYLYSDVWKYDPLTNEWTWMSGSTLASNAGNYISYCDTGSNNFRSHSEENKACFKDRYNQVWEFGGTSANGNDNYNDLWIFDYATLKYKWMHGSNLLNQSATFGQLGVPSILNIPHSRDGAILFGDSLCHIYLFAGMSRHPAQATYNDLWKFYPDSSCSKCFQNLPVASFTSPTQICPGTCVSFTNTSINGSSYFWNFPGANPSTSTDFNPQAICYNTPGSYDVTLIVTNGNLSDTLHLINYITVFPFPQAQGITQNSDTLFSNQGAATYQWLFDGLIINGATSYFYIPTQNGNYDVVCTDSNGCEVEAVIYNVIIGIHSPAIPEAFHLFPNPVNDKLEIYFSETSTIKNQPIRIFNASGMNVLTETMQTIDHLRSEVDVKNLSTGVYWIEISVSERTFRQRFIKK